MDDIPCGLLVCFAPDDVGSKCNFDDVIDAASDVELLKHSALMAGWPGFEIAARIPLSDIATAHELVEHPKQPGE